MNNKAELKFLKQLLGLQIDLLKIHCAVGSDGSGSIEGIFEGEFSIAGVLIIKNAGLRIKVGAGSMAFSLLCSLVIHLKDTMEFTGEMAVEPNGASVAATKTGDWVDPFGIRGIIISEVALQAGINAEMFLTLGFAGKAQIKNVTGEFGILLNSINPPESALHLKFNELGIRTIFDSCDPSILKSIPSEFDPVINSGYKNVEIHIVPQNTTIGEIHYEKGFRAAGELNLLGFTAKTYIEIEQESGIIAQGSISAINLLDIFTLTGKDNEPNPGLAINLSVKKPFGVHITGAVSFLGLAGYSIFANLTKEGFVFAISQKLYGLVDLALDKCILSAGQCTAQGRITFQIETLGPINIAGVTIINSIPVNTGFTAETNINISDSFSLGLSGNFRVLGKDLPAISINLSVAPADYMALYNMVIEKLIDEFIQLFTSIFGTLIEWANAIKDGLIQFTGDIANVSKQIFNATIDQAVEAYKILGKGVDEISKGLKTAYNATAEGVAIALHGAGYAAEKVAEGLKKAYNIAGDEAAKVLKAAKYGVNEVGYAVKSVYNLSAEGVALVLHGAEYGLEEVGKFLDNTGEFTKEVIKGALEGAGYAVDKVGDFMKKAFNWIPKIVKWI